MNIDIAKNVELAPQTTFKIGGKADFFASVSSKQGLNEALDFSRKNELDFFVFSGGSNILFSDKGFRGLVIKIENKKIELAGEEIYAEAGVVLSQLVKFSAENSLAGLEWAAGIPGSVGGAIRGNAGAFGGEMKDNLLEAEVFDTEKNEFLILKNEECGFAYRESLMKRKNNLIIISARFKLKKGNQEEIQNKIKEIIAKRTQNQPSGFSAGSFFKNPIVKDEKIIEKFEHDKEIKMRGDKLPAGWFIEDLGLKGKKMGGAQVSEQHGNFIINTGEATAEDVIILSSFLKQKVRDSYGVQLEEEVCLVGF